MCHAGGVGCLDFDFSIFRKSIFADVGFLDFDFCFFRTSIFAGVGFWTIEDSLTRLRPRRLLERQLAWKIVLTMQKSSAGFREGPVGGAHTNTPHTHTHTTHIHRHHTPHTHTHHTTTHHTQTTQTQKHKKQSPTKINTYACTGMLPNVIEHMRACPKHQTCTRTRSRTRARVQTHAQTYINTSINVQTRRCQTTKDTAMTMAVAATAWHMHWAHRMASQRCKP